ncbi:disease resistance protein RUN1-like [Macadamia integrifolia]|uniref:disease resistance protein RUN1-like n=1 Tax=Macadamia integrifolia TaxID=60698 RepID=UPI001C4E6225|nr:disease resistance protein RUN1-like [Macadamia integrifolia]
MQSPVSALGAKVPNQRLGGDFRFSVCSCGLLADESYGSHIVVAQLGVGVIDNPVHSFPNIRKKFSLLGLYSLSWDEGISNFWRILIIFVCSQLLLPQAAVNNDFLLSEILNFLFDDSSCCWESQREAALLQGIQHAQSYNVQKLWIECDSVAVVILLLQGLIPWFLLQRWRNLGSYLLSIQWKITYCHREVNTIVDYLSKSVAKYDESKPDHFFKAFILLMAMPKVYIVQRGAVRPLIEMLESPDISPQRNGKEAPQTPHRWKDTLRAIGDKSGWVFDNGDVSELVKLVVQRAWIRLNMVPLTGVKHPVGLQSRIDYVLSLLSKKSSSDVQFLVISGLGGIGKTTIATAIYNCIFENFSKSCFLEDIREQASQPNVIGNEIVEGLFLGFNSNGNTCLHTKGFEKMSRPRLLEIDGAIMEGSFSCLPYALRWLRWRKCPLENLFANFYHEELVIFDLPYGLFRQAWNNWPENKVFQQLKILKLSCCLSLTESPNFLGFPHLERLSSIQRLIFTLFISFTELPGSIGDLKESLVELFLDKTNIKVLPDGVRLSKKMEVLDLSLCYGLVDLPESLEALTSLRYIDHLVDVTSFDICRYDVESTSYYVFINFIGEDTRNTFVGHLYSTLKDHGIHAFMDSKDLWKGEDIGPELLRAIKVSNLSIAVFSERYTESKWCLEELSQMLECHRTNNQIIFPIFFKVKTSDVKNQTGCLEISPQRHSKEVPETLQRWKDALQVVGDKSGWVFEDSDNQSELVKEVVQNVLNRLNVVPLDELKLPVGLESCVKPVLSLLSNSSSKDVQFLGICSPGGIGKTTTAVAVYNLIFRNFSKSFFFFFENIRGGASQSNGIVSLQKTLLERICGEEIKISSSREGSSLIKKRLGKTDTLLILGDVSNHTQLKALAGDLSWFGPENKIIITTRDHSLLMGVPGDKRNIYEPQELNEEESLRLFSKYAFSAEQPPNDYMQHSIDIVSTTGGLLSTLEVLSSNLSINKDKEIWKSMHRLLEQIPHDNVYGKLKISYDNLQNDIEKAMFLNVACFFARREVENVISIWEACGIEEPRCRIEVLKRKSLLKINKSEELWMHDQIQSMGRAIVNNQSPMEPGRRSRLWSRDVIMKVLIGGKMNEMVEGIQLSFSSTENTCLHTHGFEKMPRLKLLQVDGATLEGSFQCLPSGLSWLGWRRRPFDEIPAEFYHGELVMLDLSGGQFKQAWNSWLENKSFQQLKVLKLSRCSSLIESLDFSGFPRLERLYFDYCTKLVTLHESIGQLQHLIQLDLRLSSLQSLILTSYESHGELNLPDGVGLLKLKASGGSVKVTGKYDIFALHSI